jgi:hypothetical protein
MPLPITSFVVHKEQTGSKTSNFCELSKKIYYFNVFEVIFLNACFDFPIMAFSKAETYTKQQKQIKI